jgi:hypothetical protein
MLDLSARYEKNPSVVYREIAGEAILIPLRQNVANMESIYTLDPVAAEIWNLLDGERTVGEVRRAILESYAVEPDVLSQDLEEFLQQLLSIEAVSVAR